LSEKFAFAGAAVNISIATLAMKNMRSKLDFLKIILSSPTTQIMLVAYSNPIRLQIK
jgi:hypothetical protein